MSIEPAHFLAAISKIEKLYPVPRTLGRALALLRDPHADIDDIAPLIGYDTSLTAHIIRSANSAFNAGGDRATTVSEAVQIIGFREAIRLVSLVVAKTTSLQYLKSYGISGDDFGAESVFSGLFLQRLAKLTVSCDPEEAYTAGLLRFVGRLAINQAIEDLGCGLFWDRRTPLAKWEADTVGLSQAAAGAHLLRAWQFSDEFAEAIERQDDANATDADSPLVQAVQFTSTLFPAGRDRAYYDEIDGETVTFDSANVFATQHHLSAEMVTSLVLDSQAAFQEVLKTLRG